MSWRWRIEPGLEAAVLAGLAPAIERGEPPPGAALVKENLGRATWRCEVAGVGAVYVKRDRARGLLERAKFLLLASRAAAEHRNLVRLLALGVPAPLPVASAERRTLGVISDAVLVTRAIEGAATLRERLAPERIAAAARLLRALHDAHLFHRDYHAGNILVRRDGSLALVDLQKMRRLPALPPRLRARDCAVFLHDLGDVLDEAGRRAFLESYGAAPALAGRVERAVRARRAERMASRAKRCVVPSSGFRIEDLPGLRVYRRADVPLAGALAAVDAHRRTIEAGPGAPGFVKRDPPTTCISRQGRIASEGPGAAAVAVKEFPSRGPAYALESLVRRHRGREAWMAAHALLVRGIETPLPLALVEERRCGLVFASYVLTRWLEPAEDAHLYVDRRFAQGRPVAPPGRSRGPWGEGGERSPLGARGEAEAVRAFARFVARLHAEGIYHGDLKLPNVLVVEGSAGAPPSFALLDLDAVRQTRLSRRRRAKNLAQVEDYTRYYLPQVKRTHRVRFLEEYARVFPDTAEILRAVEAHVRFRWERRERVKAARAARGEAFHDR